MIETKVKPPEKLYQAILIALKDLEAVEKDYRYNVNMNLTYHSPTSFGLKCNVCFAGSIMAKTLDCPINEVVHPSYFKDQKWNHTFKALDSIRSYDLESAIMEFYQESCYEIINKHKLYNFNLRKDLDCSITYGVDSKKFKENMLIIAKRLKKIDL